MTHHRPLFDISSWTDEQIEAGLAKCSPDRLTLRERRDWVAAKMVYVRRGFTVAVDSTCRIQKKPGPPQCQ